MGRGSSKSSRWLAGLGLIVFLAVSFFHLPLCASQAAAGNEDQALRRRVEEFYNLLRQARWDEAEAYLTPESLETYRSLKKSAFRNFEIASIKRHSDGASATVVVQLYLATPYSPQPVSLERTLRWRLLADAWHAEIPKPDATDAMAAYKVEQATSPSPPSRPEELQFQNHQYDFGLVRYKEFPVARFPFSNASDHRVTIREVSTGCKCLRLLTEKREYQPGEAGELAIEFDPTGYRYKYGQTVTVTTTPGDFETNLVVTATVVPHIPE